MIGQYYQIRCATTGRGSTARRDYRHGLECNTTDSVPFRCVDTSRRSDAFLQSVSSGTLAIPCSRTTARMISQEWRAPSVWASRLASSRWRRKAARLMTRRPIIDVVNQSIGQGEVQVTPLQVATFMAALGNGGTLYRPQLVEKIEPLKVNQPPSFEPETRGTLLIHAGPPGGHSGGHDQRRKRLARHSQFPVARAAASRWLARQVQPNQEAATRMPGLRAIPWQVKAQACPILRLQSSLRIRGEGLRLGRARFPACCGNILLWRPQTIYWFESNFGVTETPTPFGGIPTETPEP